MKTLTTYERRQMIVRILEEQSGIKVTDLAEMLNVSEGTIRNDLALLDDENQIKRVRGGAVARTPRAMTSSVFEERVLANADAKERIAQWAATMVEDGDTILLDASTTVLHMVPYLSNRRDLIAITNGIEVARRLSEQRQNTVILLGGIVRRDGNVITGLLGQAMLESLHVRTAFVSCSGFSLEAGLMETDIGQAELKRLMVGAAQRVVALVDHTKFERMTLTSFAPITQIDHLLTDSEITKETISGVCSAGLTVTVCSDHTTTTYTPDNTQATRYRIGFANLTEEIPFGRDVRRGLELAAKPHGQIELIIADNQLSGAQALTLADDFIERGIDLMIEFQIDETVGSQIMHKFSQHNTPVIAVDIPMVGATYFGVDNYKTGYLAGEELGKAIQQEWGGAINTLIVLEHPRAGQLTASRMQGQRDGVESIIGPIDPSCVITLDSGNTSSISEAAMRRALDSLPRNRHIAVICFNDDAAVGAIEAARKAYRAHEVLIVGQGADRRLRDELRRENTRIVGSTAFHPERYGAALIDIALKIMSGEPVPPAVFVEHTFISPANVDLYYPNENGGR
ncbi:MAG: substrate-binding domain-containing protein [Chloroflexota bacterium]|nr:substrate-binding domain-containing protein [Chloroflexota bacterium]